MVKVPALTAALILCAMLAAAGCSSGPVLTAIPEGLDTTGVPTTSVAMTAEHFHYTPDEVRVTLGTVVEIAVTATDGTHGFSISEYGIDETIEEGETKTIRIFPRAKGEIGFHCSHFCGLGHLGMNGKIIVE